MNFFNRKPKISLQSALHLSLIGHPKHLNTLISHPEHKVRDNIAKSGTEVHRNQLINDPSASTRYNVAFYGNTEQAKKLERDPHCIVRLEARRNLYGLNYDDGF